MPNKRKTREQKIKSSQRENKAIAFKVKSDWLTKSDKSTNSSIEISGKELGFFKADLTKTLFLTMLVLAVELALWQILSRR